MRKAIATVVVFGILTPLLITSSTHKKGFEESLLQMIQLLDKEAKRENVEWLGEAKAYCEYILETYRTNPQLFDKEVVESVKSTCESILGTLRLQKDIAKAMKILQPLLEEDK